MVRWLNKLFSIDLRSLALFRIVAGCIVLADLIVRSNDLSAFYTDSGVIPRALLPTGRFPSMHSLGGSAEWQGALFVVAAMAAISLIVGWHTRLASIMSWYLLASLQTRNLVVLNAGDSLLRMMLFWGMFLPLGAVWSLDARRKICAGTSVAFTPFLSVACGCLLLQTCLMYWLSAYFKYNDVWRNGDALYYTFSYDAYARPLATYMLQFPNVLRYLSIGALALEGIGPCLAFSPWKTAWCRLLVIAAFLSLHVSIELTLTVGLFSYASLLAWIPFLPTMFWEKVAPSGTKQLGSSPAVFETTEVTPVPASISVAAVPRSSAWRDLAAVVCLVSMGYVLLYCYSTTSFPGAKSYWVKELARPAATTMFTQNWGMFGKPTRFDGWCIAAARLADGRTVDLLRQGALIDWDKPARVVNIHPNHRWRKYFGQLAREKKEKYYPPLCQYLAREWDATHPAAEQVRWINLYLIKEWTPQPGEPLELQQVLLHRESISEQGAFAEAASEAAAPVEDTGAVGQLPEGL